MRAKLQSAAACAAIMMMAIVSMPSAHAQAAVTFDLPPQPLADSLRAVASATRINIVFDPAVVAGIRAPELKGRATARQAIAKLLARTGLRYAAVGEDTIRIARIQARDPPQTAPAPLQAPPAGQQQAARSGTDTQTSDTKTQATKGKRAGAARSPSRAELSEVVVTGTRIAGEVPASPVLTLDRATIDQSGYSSIGQLLLTLPENFSGGQNPGVIGARGNNQFTLSGASSPNLYGLGADSTLTLVNGHRLAYDGYQNGVDLSLIPLAAVDRVEIMTDGGSAIYGSDAVAGVVNVILKEHYEGVTADARYADVTSGQAAQTQYSVLAGHDWSSGNVVVAYEYSHDDPLYASERPFSADAYQPTSLYPELNRNSVFLTAHQSLSDSITASLDALYTDRSYVSVVTTNIRSQENINYAETNVRQYGISPDVSIALPHQWNATLQGTIAEDLDNESDPIYNAATGALEQSGAVEYRNKLRIGELGATGPLLTLPSGPLKLAVGAGYRYEGFQAPALPSQPEVDSSRDIQYAYGEIEVPFVAPAETRTLLESLDLSAAYRYEHYSDFGGEPTSKFGIVYVPVKSVRLRATWSQSFLAPELIDLYGVRQLYLAPAAEAGGSPGSDVLYAYGANPALGPETATSRTIALDITPSALPGLKITPTYFYIDYDHRIVEPIINVSQSLSSPLYAPFVTPGATPAQQQALIAESPYFVNFTPTPYNPANVSAIINNALQNAAIQRIHGVDLTAQDAWPVLDGRLSVVANGTWLTLLQRTISTEPEMLLSGTIFNPPSFKARATATWQRGGWGFTTAYNYVNWEWDNTTNPAARVASWNTVDVQLSYAFDSSRAGMLRGVKASLSVQNLFDRYPPFVSASSTIYPSLGYDSTNASPFGRFISAYVSKSW